MTTQHTCDHCPEAEKRKAAQIENEALKERLARAGLEQGRAVRAAVLAEREACAQLCSDLPAPASCSVVEGSLWNVATEACCDAISARGAT